MTMITMTTLSLAGTLLLIYDNDKGYACGMNDSRMKFLSIASVTAGAADTNPGLVKVLMLSVVLYAEESGLA